MYFLGESFGLKFVSPTISSAIIATIPLFASIAAVLFVREKAGWLTWIGILVSIIGIIFMLVNRDFSLTASPKGVALLLLAVFSAVVYSALVKRLTHKYSALTIISYQNLLGAFYFLPLFLIFDFKHFIQVIPNRELVLAILQLAFFGSCLAYLFFIMAVAKLGMVKTNIFSNLIPVFTAIFAYFVIHEIFTAQKVVGVMLVVSGIMVSQLQTVFQLIKREHNKIQLIKREHNKNRINKTEI